MMTDPLLPPDYDTLPAGFPTERARNVRLVVLDVDGVLTDAGVYMGEDSSGNGIELKRFNIQDGLGIKLLQSAGIEVALVSGRKSGATTRRAAELGIRECHQDNGAQKVRAIQEMLDRLGIGWDSVAMVADDLPDLAVLRRVGFPVAVANAQPEVRHMAAWRTEAMGGHGAVREFARAILLARGQWDRLVEEYVAQRDGGERG
jgi:3-deoxy-D-manno-octulosonate 8-phosphate phosphatase (KDO 8-P phosphatase)